jgi:hypothetical protein
MLARYFELREFISADDEELAEEMPPPAANRRLKVLLAQMADVESVSKKLQSEGLNLLDARDLLDGLLEIQTIIRQLPRYVCTAKCYSFVWLTLLL